MLLLSPVGTLQNIEFDRDLMAQYDSDGLRLMSYPDAEHSTTQCDAKLLSACFMPACAKNPIQTFGAQFSVPI